MTSVLRVAGIVIGGALWGATPASAQMTAKTLSEWCAPLREVKRQGRQVTVPQDFRAGYCMGFFDTLRFEDRIPRRGDQPQFCPPRDGDATTLIRTYLSYMEANPGEGAGHPLAAARKALARTWPCKAQNF